MAVTCRVCGAPAPPPFRAPPAELAPDLDLRPGEPTRHTLPNWVRTCRRCAAAAPDLSRLPAAAPVAAPEYLGLRDLPPGTLRFRRWARLCPPSERHEALLWAAWTADDTGDEVAARALRLDALAAWPDPPPPSALARRIDVLRRAGQLAEAAMACDAAAPDDPVLAFQRRCIEAGDTGRHLLSSALRPPARTPHVAHGQAPRRGPSRSFWGRLLGT